MNVPYRPGPPRLLHPDEKTVETFRRLGREAAPHRVCAEALGVCADTVRNFFNRHPEVKAVYEAELAETKARRRAEARMHSRKAGRRRSAPGQGETCPACGQPIGNTQQTITLTPADVADARRKLEDLIDRHLGAAGGPGPASG